MKYTLYFLSFVICLLFYIFWWMLYLFMFYVFFVFFIYYWDKDGFVECNKSKEYHCYTLKLNLLRIIKQTDNNFQFKIFLSLFYETVFPQQPVSIWEAQKKIIPTLLKPKNSHKNSLKIFIIFDLYFPSFLQSFSFYSRWHMLHHSFSLYKFLFSSFFFLHSNIIIYMIDISHSPVSSPFSKTVFHQKPKSAR